LDIGETSRNQFPNLSDFAMRGGEKERERRVSDTMQLNPREQD